jgi:flagellar hook protein FlgE
MGLASALSTALTGLTAAETTIDVVGNNLANSNTVGFKASTASFATQFLQTRGLGSSPNDHSGGTNPRQIGLGTMVADITPDFNQGTIEISSNPTDLAIQGEGFFIVQGPNSEQLYTRNGVFKMNAANELTTITGNRVLGWGVDEDFQIQSTSLVPLTIPLGGSAEAAATENVYLEGTLSPQGDVADTAEVIDTAILGDAQYSRPGAVTEAAAPSQAPDIGGAGTAGDGAVDGAGAVNAGDYWYKIVYADGTLGSISDTEGISSVPFQATVDPGEDSVDLTDIPTDPGNYYSTRRIYRTMAGAPEDGPYFLVDEIADNVTTTYRDLTADGGLGAQLDTQNVSGDFQYYVTFVDAGGVESRPSPYQGPVNIVDGRVHLRELPQANPADGWVARRIYRNLSSDDSDFRRVTQINDATSALSYTDNALDADIESNEELDFNGPQISGNTLLTNLLRRDQGANYDHIFPNTGTLSFSGKKGGRSLQAKELTVDNTTTVLDLLNFMEQSMGIRSAPGSDPGNPIPPDANYGNPGGKVVDSQIRLIGNNGEDNAIEIGISDLVLTAADGTEETLNMPFSSTQSAAGQSAVADFIAYDTLGIPLRVRLTAVMESRTDTSTTYRWFADSPDNSPLEGSSIAVGTGLISFDGEGNFTSSTEDTVSIYRRNVPSASPLEFDLDFSQLSGLAAENSTLAVTRQDGSAPGVLTSFIVGEDGTIRGVFSNGITRDLGQIRLSRFGNPSGLEQKGENLYAPGVNSGLPVEGNPGEQGIGSIIAGATELSNTDIGSNLIDLILASTMYRGNTRVVTTSQEMLDELLAIRR